MKRGSAIRFFIIILVCFFPAITFAQSPQLIGESEAVEMSLTCCGRIQIWDANVEAARARSASESVWSNPRLGFEFERLNEESEFTISVEQKLSIAGTQGLLEDAANAEADAVREETNEQKLRFVTTVREAFYELLTIQMKVDARADWIVEMATFDSVLSTRANAGEIAPYDVERFRKEIADIERDLAKDTADLAAKRTAFATRVGIQSGEFRSKGTLVPTVAPDTDNMPTFDLPAWQSSHRSRMLHNRKEATRKRGAAAGRWWIPEPVISGGYKNLMFGNESAHGFVVGLGFAIPIFDRKLGPRRIAAAEEVAVSHAIKLEFIELSARRYALRERLTVLVDAVSKYNVAGVERSAKLLKTARLLYESGELGILDVVDAFHGALDAKLSYLDLAHDARHAEVLLRAIEGELP